MTRAVALQDRRNHIAEATTVDQLIADTCTELNRIGIPAGRSKIARLVRRWAERVRFTGYGLAEWVADGLALDAERRARVTSEMRAISYADPTGDTAVANVKRERGF